VQRHLLVVVQRRVARDDDQRAAPVGREDAAAGGPVLALEIDRAAGVVRGAFRRERVLLDEAGLATGEQRQEKEGSAPRAGRGARGS
jgi:hypothetical protein